MTQYLIDTVTLGIKAKNRINSLCPNFYQFRLARGEGMVHRSLGRSEVPCGVHLAPDDNFSLPIHCPEPGIRIKVSPAKTQSAFLQNIVSSK